MNVTTRVWDRAEDTGLLVFFWLGPVGLLLARIGAFSPLAQAACAVVLTALTLRWWLRHKGEEDGDGPPPAVAWRSACTALVLLIGLANALAPIYYLLGNRDPGLYLLFSARIAQTGGLDLGLPAIADTVRGLGDTVARGYPGIYGPAALGLEPSTYKLMPQFVHLFCSYGALAHALSGVEGLVRANAVVGIFTLLACARLLRRALPPWAALVGTLMLGLNPAFLWNARQTLTESLAVFLLMYGIGEIHTAHSRGSTPHALTGGIALGAAVLNRVDALFLALPLVALALAFSLDGKPRRVTVTLVSSYIATSALGLLDAWTFSRPYCLHLWRGGSLLPLLVLYGTCCLAAVSLVALGDERCRSVLRRAGKLLDAVVTGGVVGLAVWVLVTFVSGQGGGGYPGITRQLAWYMHAPTLALSVAGMLIAVRDRRRALWLPLILLGGLTFFVFTWRPSVWPDHYWASRRWLTYVIPLGALFSAYALAWAWGVVRATRARPFVALIMVLPLLYVLNAYRVSRLFLTRPLLRDYPRGLAALAARLDEIPYGDCLFSNAPEIASILTYMYGHPTVLLPPETVNRLYRPDQAGNLRGRYFLGKPFLFASGALDEEEPFIVSGEFPEEAYAGLPAAVVDRSYHYTLGRIASAPGPVRLHVMTADDTSLFTQVGRRVRASRRLVSSGSEGFLQFGPYVPLEPGRYRVTWTGWVLRTPRRDCGFADVVHDDGQPVRLAWQEISAESGPGPTLADLTFSATNALVGVEFRLYVNANVVMDLHDVTLERLD